MERILVATDMAQEGDAALHRAAALAAELGAKLTLLHVMQDGLPDDLQAVFEKALMARLDGHAADLREGFGLDVVARIGIGTDWMVILDHVETEGAGLLVMGAHRHPGLIDLFRGTTVERVARGCAVPILIVRAADDRPYRSVLAATDFSLSAREALILAHRLAPQARIRLLHGYTVPFHQMLRSTARPGVLDEERHRALATAQAGMATFLSGLESLVGPSDRILVEADAASAIREQVEHAPTDLLAFGTRSRPRLAEALLGSVAGGLMADPPCDVLAVPPSIDGP